jgi:UDP-N-acetylmuramoyl-tripeptide--D-alanyl-D-alanine ligase
MFGDVQGVADAKAELIAALPAGGTAILNADYPLVRGMSTRTSAEVIEYSSASPPALDADVVAEDVMLDDELRPSFLLRSPWGSTAARLEARGAHQVGNALAAVTAAALCGVDLEAAAAALASARLSPLRMEIARTRAGAVIVNDAYNANPASMAAALRALVSLPASRRVAVLGPMAELGLRSAQEHSDVSELVARLGVRLVAFGTDAYGVEPAYSLDDAVDAVGALGEGDAVLVKGSRVAGLEVLAARLIRG